MQRVEEEIDEQSRSLISIKDVDDAYLMEECLQDIILDEF